MSSTLVPGVYVSNIVMSNTPSSVGITLASTGSGWTAISPSSWSGAYTHSHINTTTTGYVTTGGLTFTTDYNHTLTFAVDGSISWTGSFSKSTQYLLNMIQIHLDVKMAGKNAMGRSYRKGVEHCLRMAESMSKEELIDKLRQELDTRLSKEMVSSLQQE